jgi:RHS repeat-associated protein
MNIMKYAVSSLMIGVASLVMSCGSGVAGSREAMVISAAANNPVVRENTFSFPDGSANGSSFPEMRLVNPANVHEEEKVSTVVSAGRELARADVSPEQGGTVTYSGVSLEIPAGAVEKATEIRIEELTETEKLDVGMKNVTGGSAGYRFLPEGMKFLKPVTLRLPYDREAVSTQNEYENLYTYYYNVRMLKWEKLVRVEVDEKAGVLVSQTTHFTDMVNSTLKLPESPKTLNFNPTSVKDVKGGDPGSGIQLIKAPEANPQGSAGLKFEIEAPGGRRGMRPQLAVTYNSDGGNGWLGLGWSLGVSSMRVDTRWGVPRYDAAKETETYVLDGEMLTPLAHRGALVDRAGGDKVFYPRVEGAFQEIVRHGNGPGAYWWEVTDKSGTKRFYGGTPEDGLVASSVLGSGAGPSAPLGTGIGQWSLVEERDVHGNYVRYAYALVSDSGTGDGTGGVAGVQSYLSEVTWTGNRGESLSPAFRVTLRRDRELTGWPGTRRSDVGIDCRSGVKAVTADLLKQVDVYEGARLVRRYGFEYVAGAFGKSLLGSLAQYGSDGSEFFKQRFTYYTEPGYNGFGAEKDASPAADLPDGLTIGTLSLGKTVLGTSTGTNWGINGYVGLGGPGTITKSVSAGIRAGYNFSGSEAKTMLMDIDGDGILDKVFCDDSGNAGYRAGKLADGVLSFSDQAVPLSTVNRLTYDWSGSVSIGGEVNANPVFASAVYTSTQTNGETYWLDVNGDGLPDWVDHGVVYFCRLNGGRPEYTTDSNQTEAPVGANAALVVDPGLIDTLHADYVKNVAASPPLDAVRVWEAPYEGVVRITGNVKLDGRRTSYIKNGKEITRAQYEGQEHMTDGVRVSIQKNGETPLWKMPILPLDYNDYTPTGVAALSVSPGDRIFFRVNPVFDGLFDEVLWSPVIEYTTVKGAAVETLGATVDANQLGAYRYAAAQDFAYAGRSGELYPGYDTSVAITGKFRKGITSADVTVRMKKIEMVPSGGGFEKTFADLVPGHPEWSTITLAWNETATENIFAGIPAVALKSADGLLFELDYDSPIDLAQVVWEPTVTFDHYNVKGESKQIVDLHNNPITMTLSGYVNAPVYKPLNDRLEVWTAAKENGNPWVTVAGDPAHSDSTVRLWPKVSIARNGNAAADKTITGKVVLTVKRADRVEPVTRGVFDVAVRQLDGYEGTLDLTLAGVQAGEKYFFDYHFTGFTDDPAAIGAAACSLKYRFGSDPAQKWTGEYDNNTPPQKIYADYYRETTALNRNMEAAENLIPASYRGWGSFAYNASVTAEGVDRGTAPLHMGDLVISEDYVGTVDQATGAGAREPMASVMYPDPAAAEWKSADAECLIRLDPGAAADNRADDELVMSGSRKNDDHPVEITIAVGEGGATMLNRRSWAWQGAAGAGLNVAIPLAAEDMGLSLGGTLAGGNSFGIVEYIDFNGDRYPDSLMEKTITYTDANGGLTGQKTTVSETRMNTNYSGTASVGPDIPIAHAVGTNRHVTSTTSMKAGGNLGASISVCYNDFIDMNGDGLPDIVRGMLTDPALFVQLNTGYGFAPEEAWGSGYIRSSGSIETSANVNLGFDVDFLSFGGGLSAGRTGTGLFESLIDMNGDGLPDLVRKLINGTVLVRINTGNALSATEIPWTGGFPGGEWLNQSHTLSGGVCGYATVSIPIPPVSLVISAGGSAGLNMNTTDADIRDVNADGCPDFVVSGNDHNLKVYYNQYGRTNLLERVDEPLGGSIELDYERSQQTQAMPQAKWVLSGVKVNDGHSGDGADSMCTTYSYDHGRYDRYERESYGFGTVTAQKRSVDGRVLMTSMSTFDTSDYYVKGLPLSQAVYDGSGNLLGRQTNQYESVTVRLTDANRSVFTRIHISMSETDEPGSVGNITQAQEFSYDQYGNVTECVDRGDIAVWDDDVRVNVSYDYKTNLHVLGLPDRMTAYDASETLIRERRGSYSELGDLLSQSVNDGTRWLTTSLTYDPGTGNLLTVTDAAGYRLAYTYDAATRTYVTRVDDSFGYASTSSYDAGLGVVLNNTDENGNQMNYQYDAYGRLVRVFGPYDTTNPALGFQYYHTEVPARAVTQNKLHFDPANTDAMVTVVFVDGLGRVIQTKKQTEVWNSATKTKVAGMSVSGLVMYDELGRSMSESQPGFEPGDVYTFTHLAPKNPTLKEYDAKNRVTRVIFPEDPVDHSVSVMRTEYSITGGRLATVVTDPLGRQKTSYADGKGNIVEITQQKAGDLLSTKYRYDALDQIVEVRDSKNNPTSIVYDILGRKTSMTTPDTGKTDYVFDYAGRLLSKVDENLRTKGQSISYQYDYGRLKTIQYPDSGTVSYIYGTAADAAINAVGRMKEVRNNMTDVSYEYGKLGEATKVTKTLRRISGSGQTYTGAMGYLYDYLGRMETITYPDGEVVRYGYDRGGEVETVTGSRSGQTTSYVKDVAYDEYGQRAYLKYGNNVTTEYTYHPTRRWLSHIRTVASNGHVFQDMEYTFDKVGNIVRTANTASQKTIVQEYGYDDLDELTSANGSYEDRSMRVAPLVRTTYTQTFEYDIIGNMTKKTSVQSVTPGRNKPELNYALDYTYSLTRTHSALKIGDYGYQYDANGNVTAEIYGTAGSVARRTGSGEFEDSDDDDPTIGHVMYNFSDVHPDNPTPGTVVKSYVWDEENRMKEAVNGREHVYFGYDAGGERTVKWSEHGETVYLDRMYQVETSTHPALYTKHIFVGDTRLISRIGDEGGSYGGQDAEMYYYHADHLGSSNWVTDNQGAEYEHLEYAPYGESWVEEGRDSLNRIDHLFTGKELDKETGLYYFGARYLDPKTSRWMSSDPAMEEYLPEAGKGADGLPGMGGVYNAVNLAGYPYGGNNPLKYVDPTGEVLWFAIPVVIGAVLLLTACNNSGTLPTSGFERAYTPSSWNDNGSIQHSTNCYAYAFDLKGKPVKGAPSGYTSSFPTHWAYDPTSTGFAVQPGDFSGQVLASDFSNIVTVVKADITAAGGTFNSIGKNDKCRPGTYKVALVMAPPTSTKPRDYHWYRQNPDGTWSHKPGATEVTNIDASNHTIKDPETADRNGSYNYSVFIGFFEVGL